jgi:hypothetical protein
VSQSSPRNPLRARPGLRPLLGGALLVVAALAIALVVGRSHAPTLSAAIPHLTEVSAKPFLVSGGGPSLVFDTPSHRIHCGDVSSSEIGCVVDHYTFSNPPDVHDCASEAVYGGGFFMTKGRPVPICTQDDLWGQFGKGVPVLAYGDQVQFGGYVFMSQPSGVTVVDLASGDGFTINQAAYQLF